MSAATVVSASDRTTIHASFFSLTCGALGMLGVAVGTFISPGSSGTFGWALHAGGWILVSVAIIAHIEHLSNRLGRVAVICGILAAVGQGLADLPFAINSTWVSDTGWINYFNAMWAAASLLAAASIGLAAVRKEKQMEAHLASGRPGMYASEDYSTTVHASFLSLVTGAVGALLTGIASLMLIGGGGPATRLSWILYAIGSVLLAAAIIAHIEHLSLSLGRRRSLRSRSGWSPFDAAHKANPRPRTRSPKCFSSRPCSAFTRARAAFPSSLRRLKPGSPRHAHHQMGRLGNAMGSRQR